MPKKKSYVVEMMAYDAGLHRGNHKSALVVKIFIEFYRSITQALNFK